MVNFEAIRTLGGNRHIAVILAGGFGGLAVTRELGKHGVPIIVLGRDHYVTKSKYCLGFRLPCRNQVEDFLTELPRHVEEKPVLFTDSELYLEVLEKKWPLWKNSYLAPLSINNRKLTDKVNLYKSAQEIGLQAPVIYDDIEDVVEYPVIVKPLNGIAHINPQVRKAYECQNHQELKLTVELLKQQGLEVCVQQVIPGNTPDLYSVTMYRSPAGQISIGYVMRKIRQFPSDYGTGTSHVTCEQPQIVDYSIRLLESTGFVGVAEIEYKYCRRRRDFLVIEVNGRFPLHTSVAHQTNPQFIYDIYSDLVSCPPDRTRRSETGQKPVVWSFLLKDILTAKSKWSLLHYYYHHLRQSRIQGAMWDHADLLPVLYYYRYLCHRILSEGLRTRPHNPYRIQMN